MEPDSDEIQIDLKNENRDSGMFDKLSDVDLSSWYPFLSRQIGLSSKHEDIKNDEPLVV